MDGKHVNKTDRKKCMYTCCDGCDAIARGLACFYYLFTSFDDLLSYIHTVSYCNRTVRYGSCLNSIPLNNNPFNPIHPATNCCFNHHRSAFLPPSSSLRSVVGKGLGPALLHRQIARPRPVHGLGHLCGLWVCVCFVLFMNRIGGLFFLFLGGEGGCIHRRCVVNRIMNLFRCFGAMLFQPSRPPKKKVIWQPNTKIHAPAAPAAALPCGA